MRLCVLVRCQFYIEYAVMRIRKQRKWAEEERIFDIMTIELGDANAILKVYLFRLNVYLSVKTSMILMMMA